MGAEAGDPRDLVENSRTIARTGGDELLRRRHSVR
jgi:hypothetical protein